MAFIFNTTELMERLEKSDVRALGVSIASTVDAGSAITSEQECRDEEQSETCIDSD